jgi:hypothetical protein
MDQRLDKPFLGGRPQAEGERGAHAVDAPEIGFVQHVSMDMLQKCAERLDARLHLHVLPGAFAERGMAVVSSDRPLDEPARRDPRGRADRRGTQLRPRPALRPGGARGDRGARAVGLGQ